MTAGRPTTYTEDTGQRICKLLAEGQSLRAICRQEDMPCRATVVDWLLKHKGFADQYAISRDVGIDEIADDAIEIADEKPPTVTLTGAYDGGAVNHQRLRVDTRKWYISKLAPKRYGDRTAVELTGADGGPIQIDDTAKAGKLASILAVAAARRGVEEANSDLG